MCEFLKPHGFENFVNMFKTKNTYLLFLAEVITEESLKVKILSFFMKNMVS